MSKYFVQSDFLRSAGIALLRLRARLTPAGEAPRIFVNSVPKAGTHLLTAELKRMNGLTSAALHIRPRFVNAVAGDKQHSRDFILDEAAFDKRVRAVKRGQYFTSHLPWSRELADYLEANKIKTIFIHRDPRAELVSRFHYIMGLKRHHLHYLLAALRDEEERYRLLILGRDEYPQISSARERLLQFRGWVEDRAVLKVRFEELVGERGGGSAELKADALERIVAFLRLDETHIDTLSRTATSPTTTFREGQIDGWRKSIPAKAHELLLQECGDLLESFGYGSV